MRRLPPDQLPQPAEVRARLAAEGIDPDQAGAIISALFARGWPFWLIGAAGAGRCFTAFVLERRFGAVWATGEGATPAAALGVVLVLCLDTPPWAVGPDEERPPDPPSTQHGSPPTE